MDLLDTFLFLLLFFLIGLILFAVFGCHFTLVFVSWDFSFYVSSQSYKSPNKRIQNPRGIPQVITRTSNIWVNP